MQNANMFVDAAQQPTPMTQAPSNHDQTLPQANGIHEPPLDLLEMELPVVYDGQMPLGDLLSRVTQAIYAELAEMAETMPNMSDSARKRTLADWVVKIKKQVVKLYAVTRWARDAETVQKCMNITAFLLGQNQQFEEAIGRLKYAKESLDSARLRNHDLLTSLDVLTTGSYLRLPTVIKKSIVPPIPFTDAEVTKCLVDMENSIRYRLRTSEIIPIEMSGFRITNGRAYFTVPKLFETSISLQGAESHDGWFFLHVEFLVTVGGDLVGVQEFPRVPTGVMLRHITDEADARLGFYTPYPEGSIPPGVEAPPKPQLPENTFDAPLVRLFNFLQIMSMSYQLEILWFQAERMRALGWAEYLKVQMSPDRKSITVSYWMRSASQKQPQQQQQRIKLPPFGGTLTISIVEQQGLDRSSSNSARSPMANAFAKLQRKARFGNANPSDEVENLQFRIVWEPAKGAFGVELAPADTILPEGVLQIDADHLDFEVMLRKVIDQHAKAILSIFERDLQMKPGFGTPGVLTLMPEGASHSLQVHLCAEEVVIVTIDPRTGRINLRDSGDFAATGRGPRFSGASLQINEAPHLLYQALVRLRVLTIIDMAEQKAKYIGLQTFRRRNFAREDLVKLGSSPLDTLFIQLSNFPDHYLVLVLTDDRFRYALITTRTLTETVFSQMIMEDIAWLDFDRIHFDSLGGNQHSVTKSGPQPGFNLETPVLRELYSYCCARVAYMNVERQFKLRAIPFTHVNPTKHDVPSDLTHIQSSLARSVPALCVQSQDILSGAPAAEAAMPNIRVTPLNWWSEKNAQVVTSVKLKYVQQPMGKSAGTSTVIRPSKRIIYDTTQAVVSFLSENVNTCVDEFLEEWARVSKMVVIAREVSQMSKKWNWQDVKLLSFDLQTVEFAYAEDYTVSITCQDQLSPLGGNFDLRFSRVKRSSLSVGSAGQNSFNPHDDAEPFLKSILRQGHGRLSSSLCRLVAVLRDTLPIVAELEDIRANGEKEGHEVDVFAKAAGWYRLLYGDQRHALDFRLMNGHRVAILDASHSLFTLPSTEKSTLHDETSDLIGLVAIPHFKDIVSSVIAAAIKSGDVELGKVANIDVGLICNTSNVKALARSIHQRLRQRQNVNP